jgi:hypothetical protein
LLVPPSSFRVPIEQDNVNAALLYLHNQATIAAKAAYKAAYKSAHANGEEDDVAKDAADDAYDAAYNTAYNTASNTKHYHNMLPTVMLPPTTLAPTTRPSTMMPPTVHPSTAPPSTVPPPTVLPTTGPPQPVSPPTVPPPTAPTLLAPMLPWSLLPHSPAMQPLQFQVLTYCDDFVEYSLYHDENETLIERTGMNKIDQRIEGDYKMEEAQASRNGKPRRGKQEFKEYTRIYIYQWERYKKSRKRASRQANKCGWQVSGRTNQG